MKKNWDNWLKESVYIYCTIYTIITILNSVLYLIQGYRDDPSGNWHELTRTVIVLIGVTAYEMATKIPIKNMLLRSIVLPHKRIRQQRCQSLMRNCWIHISRH